MRRSTSGIPVVLALGFLLTPDVSVAAPDDTNISDQAYVRSDGGSDPVTAACSVNNRQQNEPSATVAPHDPALMSSGASYCCTVPTTGGNWAGFYYSGNGGTTWTTSLLPGYPGDTSLSLLTCRFVPGVGFEPTRCCHRGGLSPLETVRSVCSCPCSALWCGASVRTVRPVRSRALPCRHVLCRNPCSRIACTPAAIHTATKSWPRPQREGHRCHRSVGGAGTSRITIRGARSEKSTQVPTALDRAGKPIISSRRTGRACCLRSRSGQRDRERLVGGERFEVRDFEAEQAAFQ
jgi:hypothetical protein